MRKQIEFSKGSDNALKCPVCGFEYLDQSGVSIFERDEDAPDCLHVDVSRQSVTIDRDGRRNPSARRHGLRIDFDCEGCPNTSSLVIYQHKGNTYVEWEA